MRRRRPDRQAEGDGTNGAAAASGGGEGHRQTDLQRKPRHVLLPLNIIDAELSGALLLSSCISPPLSDLFLSLSPGL
ncbi:hypothetical protein JOB18_012690 [Solea senegalensis]|uniref:Uncharacterized protein n=1 Tax=Solea senegalensis TaxID=28829 RepID=A0AAV6RSQ0_SOLSE|nr:hypothetical protein JOB18_012690 [Solea senegalensis]